MTITIEIHNCLDCPHHIRCPDPDPHDWFCMDDEAVLCGRTPWRAGDLRSYRGNQPFQHKPVTTSCRPHHLRQECAIPEWCPLQENRT